YKFLDPYDFNDRDSGLFFGRDREIQILLSDIVANRLVVLFAETGTGKTSLINAGIRPRLEGRHYVTFLIRVRRAPAESARTEVGGHAGVRGLRGETMAEQLRGAAADLDCPVVLFFDQFEEFFITTLREDPGRARDFIEQVAELYDDSASGIHIVFSLRE